MAYEPKTWECGEVVTADALNHLEQGVAEASQGGGSVEVEHIKLGTVTGQAAVLESPWAVFAGNGQLDTPIDQIVDGKTVIGFASNVTDILTVHGGDGTQAGWKTMLIGTKCENVQYITVQTAIVQDATLTSLDVYAICI